MSNPYCTVAQLGIIYDIQTATRASKDGIGDPNYESNLQSVVDFMASMLDSYLTGIVSLPIVGTIPPILTWWVAVMSAHTLLTRKSGSNRALSEARKFALKWIGDFVNYRANIPGVGRNDIITLYSSADFWGKSRFDGIPYFSGFVSATGTSGGVPGAFGENMGQPVWGP